jgi:hypothetical protein
MQALKVSTDHLPAVRRLRFAPQNMRQDCT